NWNVRICRPHVGLRLDPKPASNFECSLYKARITRSRAGWTFPHHFNFAFDAGLARRFSYGPPQLVFDVLKACAVNRSEIDFHRSIRGNRVYGNPPSNPSKIERTARTPRTGTAESVNGRGHRLHRIWPAEIRPTVTAGTGHAHAKSPASQTLICDPLEARAVD